MVKASPPMESIPVQQIIPNPHNPRKLIDSAGLLELAESIRQVGVLQPVVVRPTDGRFFIEPGTMNGAPRWFVLDRTKVLPGKTYDGQILDFASEADAEASRPRFELVAGERRWRAAQEAGLAAIPAIVRDLTDVQAAELAIVENLLRSDVTAFEEAMGFRRLIDMGAHTADSLAAKLGKSRSHVFSRLRLCKLTTTVRQAIEEGKIEASTAELLSKFDTEALQTEALKEVLDSGSVWVEEEDRYPIPFRLAKKVLEDFYPSLAPAPWPLRLDDFLGGSCKACPKRSGNMPDAPAGTKGPNVCTDRHCFRDRLKIVRQRKLEILLAAGTPTLSALEEHDQAFEQYFGPERSFGYGSAWVDGAAICYEAKKDGSTWQTVLAGLDVAPITLVSPEGKTIEAYPAKEAKATAATAKRLHSSAIEAAEPKDRAAVIEENRKTRFLEAELAQAVVTEASAMNLKEFLVRYIVHTGERAYHAQKYLKAQMGEDAKAQHVYLRDLSVPQLQGVLVAMEITAGDHWNGYSAEIWAERLEMDVKSLTKASLAAYKEQAKAKSKKG